MSKKTSDISVDTLEELVKTNGDGIVTGYVRFKKIKACKGYKDARDKAAVRLSKVKGGRLISENEYAAVICFRWIIFIILLALIFISFFLWNTKTKAKVREEETTGIVETIAESKPEESNFVPDTMDIPGFSDITVSSDSKNVLLYNPMNNKCMLGYQILSGSACIYESNMIMPGEFEAADIYNKLIKGVYRIKILTTGYTMQGESLNSVSQSVILKVE